MKKIGYHVTNNLKSIEKDGYVLPKRLLNVYLTETLEGALNFQNNLGGADIVVAEYESKEVEAAWNPAYAGRKKVIKLKEGCGAKFVRVIDR